MENPETLELRLGSTALKLSNTRFKSHTRHAKIEGTTYYNFHLNSIATFNFASKWHPAFPLFPSISSYNHTLPLPRMLNNLEEDTRTLSNNETSRNFKLTKPIKYFPRRIARELAPFGGVDTVRVCKMRKSIGSKARRSRRRDENAAITAVQLTGISVSRH